MGQANKTKAMIALLFAMVVVSPTTSADEPLLGCITGEPGGDRIGTGLYADASDPVQVVTFGASPEEIVKDAPEAPSVGATVTPITCGQNILPDDP